MIWLNSLHDARKTTPFDLQQFSSETLAQELTGRIVDQSTG